MTTYIQLHDYLYIYKHLSLIVYSLKLLICTFNFGWISKQEGLNIAPSQSTCLVYEEPSVQYPESHFFNINYYQLCKEELWRVKSNQRCQECHTLIHEMMPSFSCPLLDSELWRRGALLNWSPSAWHKAASTNHPREHCWGNFPICGQYLTLLLPDP